MERLNELIESFNISVDNALILACLSIYVFVAIRILSGLLYGIHSIFKEIAEKISEKRKKTEIVKKEPENG